MPSGQEIAFTVGAIAVVGGLCAFGATRERAKDKANASIATRLEPMHPDAYPNHSPQTVRVDKVQLDQPIRLAAGPIIGAIIAGNLLTGLIVSVLYLIFYAIIHS